MATEQVGLGLATKQRRRPTRWAVWTALAGLSVWALAGCGTAAGTNNTTDNMASMPGMNASSQDASGPGTSQAPVPMKMTRNGHDVRIEMTTEETKVQIAPGVTYDAWTFDGTIPGPVLYLQQGDHVTLTLHNIDPAMPHSIDLHAATDAPAGTWTDVPPGGTGVVRFNATKPGVFLYHCATEPMLVHLAHGMYGAVIVLPPGRPRPDYTIVQSEVYTSGDTSAMLNDTPTYVVFNGRASGFVDHPLHARVGQPLTIAFVNAGPNEWSAFHIVGTVLQDAQASGNPANHLYDVQTYTVAPGDGALFTVVFHKAGTYTFVSHSMAQVEKGAVGKIVVSP